MTTPGANFAAFQDLQDLTGATDAQLATMLKYGCTEQASVNYEDVVTEQLLRLFRHITGVPWIRGWEQGARPEGQYAAVWFFGARIVGSPVIDRRQVFIDNVLQDDMCEVVTQPAEYQFQLDVYRDNGAPRVDQDGAVLSQPRYSASDVLIRLATAFGHTRFRSALTEKCIFLDHAPFGSIRNLSKTLVQNTFETRASVDFHVRVNPTSSLRVPTFGSVDWGFLCPPESELFPDPPAPVEC